MTDLVNRAFEAARALPADEQEEIARMVLSLAADTRSEPVDAAHLPALMEGLAQTQRKQFASDAEVETALRKFDP